MPLSNLYKLLYFPLSSNGTRGFFACGSSAPVRVEGKGSVVAWLTGALEVPNVQGHGLPPLQELWPYQSLFASLL